MDEIRFNIQRLDDSLVEARWPTDAELKKRQKARVIITRDLGRGSSETEILGGEKADLRLLKAITSREDLTDADEAVVLVRNLVFAQVIKSERDGSGLIVKIGTFLGEKTFNLKRPSASQIKRADGIVRSINRPYNATEVRVNIDLSAEIFDELCEQKDTSIIFKHVVTQAVVGEVNRLLESSDRP